MEENRLLPCPRFQFQGFSVIVILLESSGSLGEGERERPQRTKNLRSQKDEETTKLKRGYVCLSRFLAVPLLFWLFKHVVHYTSPQPNVIFAMKFFNEISIIRKIQVRKLMTTSFNFDNRKYESKFQRYCCHGNCK